MTRIDLQRGSFNDCDEWGQMASGWDLRLQQLDRGTLRAEMTRIETSGLVLQQVSASRRLHQSGCGPEGLLTFGLPTEPHLHRCFGRELSATGVINFGRRGGYESVSEPGFTGQTVSVPRTSLLEACASIGAGSETEVLLDRAEEFVVSPWRRKRLLALGSALLHCVSSGASGNPDGSELAADFLYLFALSLTDAEPQDLKLSRATRIRAVDRALDLIHMTSGQVTVQTVCRYSAVSARSLSRAFSERFGLSTKQYMVTVRLNGVRRVLKQGQASVTDAASQFGFWHLGQFSADYRRMFGELPSHTLKTARIPS